MALTRQERILLHKKAQTPLTGAGAPSKLDGKDGDVAYRRLSGVGVVHYIKREGEWQALSSTDKMPAERATIRVAGGTGASITDHGGMSGLGDDDHTQYLLVDGTRAVTGDLSLSGGDGALTFTVAGENSIKIPDNQASALIIEEANNAYLTFNTANSGGEKITLGKKLEAGSVEIEGTAFDINGGDISAATISGGLTWSSAQNLNSQALTNVNIDSGDISAVTISGGLTWSAAQDLNNQNLTNADIDSGAIDGTTIGASSATTIKGTTIDATTDFTIDGLVITADDITNDAALEIQTAAGDITLDPGGNNVLPGSDDADDLGKSDQQWKDLYIDGVAYIDTLNADALGANLDHANYNSTNVDIDSGAIDGTAIGASSHSTIKGTTIDATTDFTIGTLIITDDQIQMTPSTSDTVTISADTNGVLNITTVDNAAAAANIVITADGTLDLNSVALDIDSSGAITIDGATTVAISGASTSTYGDDTAVWSFNGSGAVSETGMTTFSLTPSSTVDIDSGGALTLDGSSISIGTDADVAVDFNASSFDLDASGAITLDAGAASNLTTSAGALTITSAAAATWGTGAGSLSLHGTTGILLREGSATILQIDNSRNIITTNTAQVDLDCSGDFSIESSGGVIYIGNDDIDQNINIGTQGERTISVGTGSFADDINIGNATGATALDLDAGTGGVTIDSTGTVSIDGADDMNFTITSSTGGEDLTIEQIGANNSSIFIKAAGTGADAIFIDATAGSMSIGSSLVDQKILTLGNTSSTYLKLSPHDTTGSEKILLHNAAGTDDESIKIHSVAGGITMLSGSTMFLDADNLSIGDAGDVPVEISATTFDLDATSWIRIDGTAVSIDGTDDSNLTVTGSNKDLTLSVAGGSTQTLTISSAGTGTNAIDINATAGGVDVDASGAIALDAGAASNLTTSAGALTITSAAAATWSTAAGNLTVDSAAGVLVLDGHTGITLDASNSGNIEINVTAADDILIGNDAVAQDILLGNAAATQVDLTAILVDINGGSSGVTIDGAAASNFTTSAGAITIDAEASTVTVDGHTGVTVQSTNSGNITLDSVADIVLSAAGGNVTMDDGTTTVFDFNTNDPELKIMDDAQVANYASIAVGSNGATTLATVDADAAAANFTLDVDGDIIFDADGGDIAFEDGGSRALKIDMDATAGDAIFADAGNTEIFRIDGSEDSLRIKNHAQALTNPYSLYVLPTGGCHYTSGAADYQQNVSVVCIHDLEPGTNVDNNSWYS